MVISEQMQNGTLHNIMGAILKLLPSLQAVGWVGGGCKFQQITLLAEVSMLHALCSVILTQFRDHFTLH